LSKAVHAKSEDVDVLREQINLLENKIEKMNGELRAANEAIEEYERKAKDNNLCYAAAGVDQQTALQILEETARENTQHQETIENLYIDLEETSRRFDAKEKHYQNTIRDLQKEMDLLKSRDGAGDRIGDSELKNQMDISELSPNHLSRRFSLTFSGSGTSLSGNLLQGDSGSSAHSESDDILAAECSNLRTRLRDQESHRMAASDAARVTTSLERELGSLQRQNKKLQRIVLKSKQQSELLQEDNIRLSSESKVLNSQLAELVSVMNSRSPQSLEAISLDQIHNGNYDGTQEYDCTGDKEQDLGPIHEGSDEIASPPFIPAVVDNSIESEAPKHPAPTTPISDTQSPVRGNRLDTEDTDVISLFRSAMESFDEVDEGLSPEKKDQGGRFMGIEDLASLDDVFD